MIISFISRKAALNSFVAMVSATISPFIQQPSWFVRSLLCIIKVAILFSISSPLRGATVLSLEESHDEYSLGKYVEYFATTNKELSIKDLVEQSPRIAWLQSKSDVPSFGFSDAVYWVKLTLRNSTPDSRKYFLELGYPLLDSVSFYLSTQDGKYTEEHVGRLKPFGQREVEYHNFVFPIVFNGYETRTFYLRCHTTSSVQLPLYLWSVEKFVGAKANEQFGFGIFYGIMLVMVLYNFNIFLSTRDRNYLYYVCYIFSHAIFQMGLNGLTIQYIWPNSPKVSSAAIPFALGSTGFFLSLFTIKFLQTAKYMKWWDKILRALNIWSAVIMILSIVMSYEFVIQQCALLTIIINMAIFVVAGISYRHGYRPAGFFLLAFTVFTMGATLGGLRSFGLIPINFITNYSVLIGSAMDVILLSLALGDRLKILQTKHDESQALLRREMEMRVVIISDLAHRMNNPLNYIMTGAQALAIDLKNYHNTLLALFYGLDDNDTENREVKNSFIHKKEKIDVALASISKGVDRSAASVEEIRALSGVDGKNNRQQELTVIVGEALVRVKEMMGVEAHSRIDVAFDNTKRWEVFGNRYAFVICFERIISDLLKKSSAVVTIAVDQQKKKHVGSGDSILIDITMASGVIAVEGNPVLSLLESLLYSCGGSVTVLTSSKSVGYQLKLPTNCLPFVTQKEAA